MWRLIWVWTDCLSPFYGFPDKNGLKEKHIIFEKRNFRIRRYPLILQYKNKRAKVAINRLPELKGVIVQTLCVVEI